MSGVHVVARRETKYTVAVRAAIQKLGHATNAELAEELRNKYPYVSDTTVHRVTHRLCEDGELRHAPNAADGSLRYDSNTSDHDHFLCTHCGKLRDMIVPQACRTLIQHQLGGCRVKGMLTISGVCHHCVQE